MTKPKAQSKHASRSKKTKTKSASTPLSISIPREAQADFELRHQGLLREYGNLRDAQDFVLSKVNRRMMSMNEKMIYLLARQTLEDFDEILLLCSNGFSTGGLKILRGMFERTVTVCYLQKHNEDIELYQKYFYVRQRKETIAIRRTFPNAISAERLEQNAKEYEEVKELFQVPVCAVCKFTECLHCKKLRDNHNWTRKDILQLAQEAEHFDPVVYLGYYRPIHETHPTAQALVNRIRFNASGKWEYIEGAKPDIDKQIFVVSHFLVIRAIEAMALQFKIPTKRRVGKLYGIYLDLLKSEYQTQRSSQTSTTQ